MKEKEQEYEGRLIERILQLLELLKERGIQPSDMSMDGWPQEKFSAEERARIRETWDILRFLDEIPGGFLIYYAGGKEEIIYASQGILRIFRCETMEEFRDLTGNSFRGVVHPEDLKAAEANIQRQIRSEQKDMDYVEYRIRCKDGTIRWVEDYGKLIRREGGDIFYIFLGEATEERGRQQIEQKRQLADALEKASLAVKAKNTFLSHISHDMRTPLNVIFGFTSLAKTNLHDPDTLMDYLEQIEGASQQLLDMITKVLYLSDLFSAAGPSELECNLRQTVRDAYDFLLPQTREKSISFTIDCSQVVHNSVYADQEKLKQLVLNLVNNAVTYTEPGGRVEVILREAEEFPSGFAAYHLLVKDNGIGMGEEFKKEMFEPFCREKSSTLSGVHGIGLGLTIVKSIVELMNGTIDVQSSVNEGTTFDVKFIFRIQPRPEVPAKDTEAVGQNRRILLVEDNEINREIETELLERMGFTVTPAENGKVALDCLMQAEAGCYDVIIMDLQMPVMDGWQATTAIRRLDDPVLARTPIIALSADILLNDRRRALECGVNVYLSKPMDFSVLLETIEKVTEKKVERADES